MKMVREVQKHDKQIQKSETFLLGALLAVAGGYLDAYTYLVRGHVFANAQTGNIVLLGMNLADRKFMEALHYLVPIMAFALGVLVTEWMKARLQQNQRIHWRQVILLIEIILLVIVAFVPCGKMDVYVNLCISFVCAMQVECFRKFNGNAFASTMCTGNLRSATESLFHAIKLHKPQLFQKSMQYYGIIGFFILGAILGFLLTNQFGGYSVIFAGIILILPVGMMFF